MRVLVAHNRYQSASPSGENAVVSREVDLLRNHGVDVEEYSPTSDDIASVSGHLLAAMGPLYSPRGVTELARVIERFRPNVVHLHNVFPLISPSAVRLAKRTGAAVVQTVHNYRHGCVNGLHYRHGAVCTECLSSRTGLPALRHGCYRQSQLQTIPMVVGQVLHRETWRLVDRFLALTPFMAEWLRNLGFADERVLVRPSWVPDPGNPSKPGESLLFLGRLDENKGVGLLLESLRRTATRRQVMIAGSGPLQSAVERATRLDSRLSFVGRLDAADVGRALASCSGLIVPSVCFEGFPLTIAEAFAHGRPVVALKGTSSASVVESEVGWTSDPTPDALARIIDGWDDRDAARRGRRAREVYLARHTPNNAAASLIAAYEGALGCTAEAGSV